MRPLFLTNFDIYFLIFIFFSSTVYITKTILLLIMTTLVSVQACEKHIKIMLTVTIMLTVIDYKIFTLILLNYAKRIVFDELKLNLHIDYLVYFFVRK
jgi:hypothetical protein